MISLLSMYCATKKCLICQMNLNQTQTPRYDEAATGATAAQKAEIATKNQEREAKRVLHWAEKRKARNSVTSKLREGAYEGRRRELHSQLEEEK